MASRPSLNVPSPELLRRIRAEYLEMPGLRLTAPQAQCLFGLDPETCDAVSTLLDAKSDVRRRVRGSQIESTRLQTACVSSIAPRVDGAAEALKGHLASRAR